LLRRVPEAEPARPRRRGAGRWYDDDYLPGVAAARGEQLHEAYAYKTDADLWLWMHQLERQLVADGEAADFAAAARRAARVRVPRSFRRRFLRERTTPLTPRA